MSKKLPSETFVENFYNPEPSFYTRMPDIIFHLKQNGKRLSVHAQQLYRCIKMFCGNSTKCWANRDTLADLSGMSAGMISKCKKELTQKFDQLAGNSLITIETKKKKDCVYHEITVVCIWRFNNEFMSTYYTEKVMNKNVRKSEGMSPHDTPKEGMSPHDTPSTGSMSPHDTNKIQQQKDTFVKEQDTNADALPVCSSFQEKELSSCQSEEDAIAIRDWCRSHGVNERATKRFSKDYNAEDFFKAVKYTEDQRIKKSKKGEEIPNPSGYLSTVLKNRYWGAKC